MRFHPLHFGWVALPPQPKGVIVFIGGAFFGTFPTFFYRAFLRTLYDSNYAVVALPFRFTFNHWDIALSLSIYQAELQHEIKSLLRASCADAGMRDSCEKSDIPYFWIAHSLGCKYVALLELLSESEDMRSMTAIEEAFGEIDPRQLRDLKAKLNVIEAEKLSLFNQPQLLIDPVIASLDAAIPLKPLERIFAPLLKVIPSRETTFELIDKSSLFALTKIFSLQSETAGDTVNRLSQMVRRSPLLPLSPLCIDLLNPKPLLGAHLSILGLQATDGAISKTMATAVALAEADARMRQCAMSASKSKKKPVTV